MDDYVINYRGYSISSDDVGTFVGDMEFVSLAEAEDWIDAQLDGDLEDVDNFETAVHQRKIYTVFFVAPNAYRHSSVDVPAYSADEAIDFVENEYCPGAHVIDWDIL